MRCYCALIILLCCVQAQAASTVVWIGTTTPRNGESKGIYRADFDTDKGVLSTPTLVAEVGSPGFVALHPNGKVLYSVGQLPGGEASVIAYKILQNGQRLELLNSQPIGDGGAAHLTVDQTGRCLFSAQYGGGSVAAFPLASDGSIQPRSCLVEHEGSGPNERRQTGPHPHSVQLDPGNRFLLVPDLGIDQVVIYEVNLDSATIKRHGAGHCPPGAGPRHMKFHPSGRFVYVLNELQVTVTAFKYDGQAGTLEALQTIPALPESMWEVPSTGSEIRVHPTGRFVYAAIRGHDTIAAFLVNQDTGKLALIEREPVRGSWPRNFNLDPTGKWLLAAGRNSNTIAVFQVDPESGGLIFSGKSVNTPTPICIEFQR